ncbi:MAG TPA: helix-turn-helix domain-containing protein [Dongiaceae bacterium]|nr:helix-turn-helix domain-containing protein [Dongiaceae bacterium]
MAQVNQQDWLNAGLNQLRSEGPMAISGEKLARRLDVTRGSFYHHFRSMDEYVDKLMDEWEKAHTQVPLEEVHAHATDTTAEMALLMEAAWNADAELEIAIRQWAFSNDRVRQRVEKVDATRMGHLRRLYGVLTKDPVKGDKFAQIAYYGLLGAMHAWPRHDREDMRRLILEIQALLLTEL